jgi:predicted dehydrogenase
MKDPLPSAPTRRQFIKTAAVASALAGVKIPFVHAAEDNTTQVVLVGCGGRGTGAAANALSVTGPPVKLVAMADVFQAKLDKSYKSLSTSHADKVDVPEDRRYIGFDGYKKAMDHLKKGDIAIFTTPLAFRWVHFGYAIEKGLNVFMEKPLVADGASAKKMYALAEEATKKNLKVGVGLMSRHSTPMRELNKRIQDGEIGEIILMRGYRMSPPIGSAFSEKWPGLTQKTPETPSELLWQISRFHSFLWASGGCFADFYIHHIDHCCWMKNAWPIKAQAVGGRHYRNGPDGEYVDQNFDSYGVEYTFEDGTKFMMDGRCMIGAAAIYSSYAHGTKGLAVISKSGDIGTPSMTFKGQNMDKSNLIWESTDKSVPYQNEWDDLLSAIRTDTPYNEVKRGVDASVATGLGRMAAHTAQEVTWDDFLNSDFAMAPDADKFTMDSPAPVRCDKDGKYPVPQPGIVKKYEYEPQKNA